MPPANPKTADPEVPVQAQAAPAGGRLGERAARGAFWVFLGYGLGQALRLGGNVALTYQLEREDFGRMALVNSVLLALTLFSDFGIGPSIVQNKRGEDPRFLDTLWTVQVVRGGVLWLVACLAAWPLADYYAEPKLTLLLPVAGLTAAASGFASTKFWTANRALSMARLTAIELSSQALALVVMLVWAWLAPSVWALVAGALTSAAVKTVLSHGALSGHPNRLAWDGSAARELLHFARWIFVSTILTFCAMQSDRLVFGKLIPIALLGVYSIATMIGTLPQTSLNYVWGQIVFPVFSRIQDAGEELTRAFERVRWPILLLGGWMVSGLIAGGPTAIDLLWSEKFAEAGWMIQLLALGGWFQVLTGASDAAFLARGRTRSIALCNAVKVVSMLVLIPLGYRWRGFPGALLAYSLCDLPRYGAALGFLRSLGLRPLARDLALTALTAAAGGLGAWVAELLEGEGVHVALRALAITMLITSMWLPLVLALRRQRAAPA
jgi:O-antigen/teichoic acid export membrane protein